MTTREQHPPRAAASHYSKMLELANQMGCQLEVTQDDRSTLRGFCPFHEGLNVQQTRTLRISARDARFSCHFCRAEGNPVAFFCKVWGINISDAHMLLGSLDGTVPLERPPFPKDAGRQPGAPPEQQNRWLNSAVLTRATKFYRQQLMTNYPPLMTLAKLGVPASAAAEAGLGYSIGTGLREYLVEQTDVTEDELKENALWNRHTQLEALAGRITISDLDYTGATLWITSMVPEEERHGHTWRPERPYNYGIPGRKPWLFGQYSASDQTPWALYTDDPRLYIVAVSNKMPAMLMTQYRQPGEDLLDRCRRTATALLNRRMPNLTMAMHDREAAGIIESLINQADAHPETLRLGREHILPNLKPETRNLAGLREPDTTHPAE